MEANESSITQKRQIHRPLDQGHVKEIELLIQKNLIEAAQLAKVIGYEGVFTIIDPNEHNVVQDLSIVSSQYGIFLLESIQNTLLSQLRTINTMTENEINDKYHTIISKQLALQQQQHVCTMIRDSDTILSKLDKYNTIVIDSLSHGMPITSTQLRTSLKMHYTVFGPCPTTSSTKRSGDSSGSSPACYDLLYDQSVSRFRQLHYAGVDIGLMKFIINDTVRYTASSNDDASMLDDSTLGKDQMNKINRLTMPIQWNVRNNDHDKPRHRTSFTHPIIRSAIYYSLSGDPVYVDGRMTVEAKARGRVSMTELNDTKRKGVTATKKQKVTYDGTTTATNAIASNIASSSGAAIVHPIHSNSSSEDTATMQHDRQVNPNVVHSSSTKSSSNIDKVKKLERAAPNRLGSISFGSHIGASYSSSDCGSDDDQE